jgi:hypothetical protein
VKDPPVSSLPLKTNTDGAQRYTHERDLNRPIQSQQASLQVTATPPVQTSPQNEGAMLQYAKSYGVHARFDPHSGVWFVSGDKEALFRFFKGVSSLSDEPIILQKITDEKVVHEVNRTDNEAVISDAGESRDPGPPNFPHATSGGQVVLQMCTLPPGVPCSCLLQKESAM